MGMFYHFGLCHKNVHDNIYIQNIYELWHTLILEIKMYFFCWGGGGVWGSPKKKKIIYLYDKLKSYFVMYYFKANILIIVQNSWKLWNIWDVKWGFVLTQMQWKYGVYSGTLKSIRFNLSQE